MENKELFVGTVSELFHACAEDNSAIEVISLSTADGFSVYSYSPNGTEFEDDTMSAAASTLYSVSNAVAQQILAKEFKSTFIEANKGNVSFVALEYDSKDYVLAMSASESMNIASLRISINRLAEVISQITL